MAGSLLVSGKSGESATIASLHCLCRSADGCALLCSAIQVGSYIFQYPRLQKYIALSHYFREVIWLRTFGAVYSKAVELRGNWPGLPMLRHLHKLLWEFTKQRPTRATTKKSVSKRGRKTFSCSKNKHISSHCVAGFVLMLSLAQASLGQE